MDHLTLAALVAVVAFAFTVEAALGFGATVVAVAIGSMLLPVDAILPVFVPLNVILSAIIVARDRRSIAWRALLVDTAPYIGLGLPLGIILLAKADERTLKLLFGGFVIVLSAVELVGPYLRAPSVDATPSARTLWIGRALLVLGGVIHGAFATGGPMVVYVLGRELGSDKARFRGTLSVLWLVINIILVASYVLRGALDMQTVRTSGWLAISLVVGLAVGEIAFRRIPAERFRTFVFVLLLVAGVVLVGRNV